MAANSGSPYTVTKLEQIAVITIVRSLLDKEMKGAYSQCDGEYLPVEQHIENQISYLPLPEKLKSDLRCLIRKLHQFRLFLAVSCHVYGFVLNRCLLHAHFTPSGKIDVMKSFSKISDDDYIPKRFGIHINMSFDQRENQYNAINLEKLKELSVGMNNLVLQSALQSQDLNEKKTEIYEEAFISYCEVLDWEKAEPFLYGLANTLPGSRLELIVSLALDRTNDTFFTLCQGDLMVPLNIATSIRQLCYHTLSYLWRMEGDVKSGRLYSYP